MTNLPREPQPVTNAGHEAKPGPQEVIERVQQLAMDWLGDAATPELVARIRGFEVSHRPDGASEIKRFSFYYNDEIDEVGRRAGFTYVEHTAGASKDRSIEGGLGPQPDFSTVQELTWEEGHMKGSSEPLTVSSGQEALDKIPDVLIDFEPGPDLYFSVSLLPPPSPHS